MFLLLQGSIEQYSSYSYHAAKRDHWLSPRCQPLPSYQYQNTVKKQLVLKLFQAFHTEAWREKIIGSFLAPENKETGILVLVRGRLVMEKVFIDEVLATNENIPRFTNTLESQ